MPQILLTISRAGTNLGNTRASFRRASMALRRKVLLSPGAGLTARSRMTTVFRAATIACLSILAAGSAFAQPFFIGSRDGRIDVLAGGSAAQGGGTFSAMTSDPTQPFVASHSFSSTWTQMNFQEHVSSSCSADTGLRSADLYSLSFNMASDVSGVVSRPVPRAGASTFRPTAHSRSPGHSRGQTPTSHRQTGRIAPCSASCILNRTATAPRATRG